MKRKLVFSFLSLCVMSFIISGCASIPLQSKSEDMAAKKFEPVANQSKIYVFRKKAFAGAAIKLPLTLDSVLKGPLASGTFFVWNVSPGKHEVFCSGTDDASLTLETEPGKIYFIQQLLSEQTFQTPGCILRRADEQKAKEEIKNLALGQNS